jgi:CRP/FNR family transcriptional regulator, cyclic AMP receptor protein
MSVQTKTYSAGQTLFSDGDPSRSIFIVRKGAISIRKRRGQIFVEVSKVTTGEVLGELSFFDRRPRSATAVALIDVELIEIPFESMEKIYSTIPSYMQSIMMSLAERLRRANETIVRLQKQIPGSQEVQESGDPGTPGSTGEVSGKPPESTEKS